MKLDLLVLRCADIHLSKQFYEQLGLIFNIEQHGKGPSHYSSVVDGIVLELYPLNKDEVACTTRLGFSVGDVSSAISKIGDHTRTERDGNNIYIVQDPDGRKIEIMQAK